MILATAQAQVVPIGLTEFLTVATCLLSLFFGISYTIMRRWWRYQMGWNLFVLRVSIGLVLLPYTLHLLFGLGFQSGFYQWYSIVVFTLVPVALAHITWMLFQPAVSGLMKRLGLVSDKPKPPAEDDDLRQPPRSSSPVP